MDKRNGVIKSENYDSSHTKGKVKLNVGGTVFFTTRDTINQHPGTLLSQLSSSSSFYDKVNGEYYFDRDPVAFACILNFYRTSELHLPTNLCGNSLRRELKFWQVEENNVSECCWKLLHETDQGKEVIDTLNTKLKDDDMATGMDASSWKIWQRRIYLLLDKPNSSKAAKIWSYIFLLFIIASAIIYCVETVPEARVPRERNGKQRIGQTMLERLVKDKDNIKLKMIIESEAHPIMYYIDIVCLSVFTVELIIHFITYPKKVRFFRKFLNWIDIITVSMGWVVFFMEKGFKEGILVLSLELYIAYLTLKSLYILRLFRFFRLADRFTGLKVMMLAVKSSLTELSLLLFSIMILATMFGSFEFYCEFDNNHFDSIPISIWWALVTMTTVGYGDYYPASYCGRGMGTMCALSGLLILAMPIAVIATNFNEYYSRNQCREKKRKKHGWAEGTEQVGITFVKKM
ncbi:potassium voltage-gated channel protein Shaw-like [Haliotis asinina]|uniref:potassium voltage-gated channel protein Shaw-like n=1 Tax=Haliotis asinina TaxID=109174 RepID=UPI0035321107